MLEQEEFINLVKIAPLVSIDLIIKNRGKVLLGLRKNAPAKDFWFVPGGIIRKHETLAEAMLRISQKEVNLTIDMKGTKLLGVNDHIYPDSTFEKNISTRYVCIAYQYHLSMDVLNKIKRDEQHSDLKWWDINEILNSDLVHENTKNYFTE